MATTFPRSILPFPFVRQGDRKAYLDGSPVSHRQTACKLRILEEEQEID